jgi:hypothetical protein
MPFEELAEQAYLLSKHSELLLPALACFDNLLEMEKNGNSFDYSLQDINIDFRGAQISPEGPPKSTIQRLSLFIDPGLNGIRKQVTKKFPDTGDIGKVFYTNQGLLIFTQQTGELLNELKPFYNLYIAAIDFIDLAYPIISSILQLKINVFIINKLKSHPLIAPIFLDLLVGVSKVLIMTAKINKYKKVIFFAYNTAYTLQNRSPAPMWQNLTAFIRNEDKPLALLQTLVSNYGNLEYLMSSIEDVIKQNYLTSVSTLRKEGTYMATPELTSPNLEVTASNQNVGKTALRSHLHLKNPFESYYFCFLAMSASEHVPTNFLEKTFELGYYVNITQDQVLYINKTLVALNEFETLIKDNPKKESLSNLKVLRQEILNHGNICYKLRSEKREYIIPELHKFINMMYSKHNFPRIMVLNIN